MHVIRGDRLIARIDERVGGEITRIEFDGRPLLASYDWESPVSVFRSVGYGDPKTDWLSAYRGGWQLLVPNAGAACDVGGVPLPFHGEWSRTRPTVTARSANHVTLAAGTRLPLSVEREIRIESGPERVLARTTVTNTGLDPVSFVWAEHPAFEVGAGDLVDLPPVTVMDSDGSPVGSWPVGSEGRDLSLIDDSPPTESVHYLVGFESGWAAIRRQALGIALAWDIADFPVAWIWHEIGSAGFPFFGRASLVAIEPASSWPGTGLRGAVERGQAIHLEPGAARSTTVALIPFEADARAVVGASVSGNVEFGSL